MHYRPLGGTGLTVSVLGFGASSLGGVFRTVDDQESIRTVHTALDLGINFIDTSPCYGNTRSERILGLALKGVRRDRYILATKVGQHAEGQFDFSAEAVMRSLDESCRRLGTEHIDLLQCHDIEFGRLEQIVQETLPALVRLRTAGRIGHIGITGLPLKALQAAIEQAAPGVIETVLSFCRYELNDTALADLIPYFRGKGAGVINASPTGMGLLTKRGVPSWHPATAKMLAVAGEAMRYCEARGADPVKLALQFSLAHPGIATTLVGTANPDNLRRNAAYVDEPIDFPLMAEVLARLRPIANHNFTRGLPENRDELVA